MMKKKILIILIVFVALFSTFLFLKENKNISQKQKGVEFCFYSKDKTKDGSYDKQFLYFVVDGGNVSGDYEFLPAQKDSKVGSFSGSVFGFDPAISGRKMDLIWETLAEGTTNKEQLFIVYGEGSAVAYFGEQIKNQDNILVYKDPNNIYPTSTMSQIDCASLGEMLVVESYIRSEIASIATNKPVLGGTWYVVDIFVNTNDKIGEVVYEDGHIQSTAKFSYSVDVEGIKITSFQVVK